MRFGLFYAAETASNRAAPVSWVPISVASRCFDEL